MSESGPTHCCRAPPPCARPTGTFEAAATASQLQPAADAKLSAPLPPIATAAAGGQQHAAALHLAVSACLWGCLQRSLSPGVFLPQLGDRFVRLLTQLLVRFHTWLLEVVQQRQQAAAAQAQGPAPPANPAAPAAPAAAGGQAPAQQQQPAAAAAGATGPVSPGGAAPREAPRSGPAAWAPSMPVESVALICADADTVQALVCGPLVEQLLRLLDALPGDVQADLAGMLQQLGQGISAHGQRVLLLLAGEVLEQCVAAVRQLKGITATYRMTAKGPPVRHSHYVAGARAGGARAHALRGCPEDVRACMLASRQAPCQQHLHARPLLAPTLQVCCSRCVSCWSGRPWPPCRRACSACWWATSSTTSTRATPRSRTSCCRRSKRRRAPSSA
jgi:hypothetical protein